MSVSANTRGSTFVALNVGPCTMISIHGPKTRSARVSLSLLFVRFLSAHICTVNGAWNNRLCVVLQHTVETMYVTSTEFHECVGLKDVCGCDVPLRAACGSVCTCALRNTPERLQQVAPSMLCEAEETAGAIAGPTRRQLRANFANIGDRSGQQKRAGHRHRFAIETNNERCP